MHNYGKPNSFRAVKIHNTLAVVADAPVIDYDEPPEINDAPPIVVDGHVINYGEPPKINDAPPVVIDAHVIDYDAAVTVYYQVVNAPDATSSIDDHGVVVSGLQRWLTRGRQ